MYYNQSNYDGEFGKNKVNPIIGKQSSGRPFINTSFDYEEELQEDETDEFVDDINQLAKKKINKKIVDSMAMDVTDKVGSYRKDNETLSKNRTFGINEEYSANPRRQFKADQAFRTTGNFVGIGTQYGSSRPHKLLTDIEDDNIFNLEDMKDPIDRSWQRQQNRIKKVLSMLEEYLLHD